MPLFKPIEILFKKVPLALLSLIRRTAHKRKISIDPNSEYKILFIRPERIGDIFITFPVFDLLLKHFPRVKISLLVSPACRPITNNDPRFYKTYYYQKYFWSDLSELKKIRSEKYNCVVDLVGRDSVISLMLAWFGAPTAPSIGVGKNSHRKQYDYNYDLRNNNSGHVISNSLKLLESFGISFNDSDCFAPPYIDEETDRKAVELFKQLDISRQNQVVIGFNLSAGAPERMISNDIAAEILNKIINQQNRIRIILFAIGPERQKAEQLQKLYPEKIKLIPGGLNLIEASAVISKLDIFMTPDTSLVHIARSFKVPVVAFYRRYMENYKIWYPFGQSSGVVLSKNEDNISDLTADLIFEELIKVFEKTNLEEKWAISRRL